MAQYREPLFRIPGWFIFFGTIIGLALIMWLFFMKSIVTEAGYQTVLVDQPFFGDGGVRPRPMEPGRMVVFRTTQGIPVQSTPITYAERFGDLPTKDNSLLNFQTSIQVKVTDPVLLISKFGENWYENNIVRPFTSSFRDITKSKTMTQIMSDPQTSQEMEQKLIAIMNEKVRGDGIPVVVMDFNMGQGRPNDEVVDQMNQTIAQQQASKTYVEAKNAQDQRKESEIARAVADKAYADKMNFTPEQVIQLEAINKYSAACTKSSCVIMSGGAVPITLTK